MSDLKFKPHHRQFVIDSQPFLPDRDWCCRQLDHSIWISYCPNLRISWARDRDGVIWGLLGLTCYVSTCRIEWLSNPTKSIFNLIKTCFSRQADLRIITHRILNKQTNKYHGRATGNYCRLS